MVNKMMKLMLRSSACALTLAVLAAAQVAIEFEDDIAFHPGQGFALGPPISEAEKLKGGRTAPKIPTEEQRRWAEEHETVEKVGGKARSIYREVDRRWPNNEIPYTIEAAFTAEERTVIAQSIQEIEESTCITFRAKRESDRDWVEVFRTGAAGCWAILGFSGPGYGAHRMSLEPPPFENGPTCIFKSVIVHEFLHILGVNHEHARPDRDTYVTIDWTNLRLSAASNHYRDSYDTEDISVIPRCSTNGVAQATANFDNCVSGLVMDTHGLEYDYDSVMHYGLKSFAVSSANNVMTPKQDSVTSAGNSVGLTELDKKKLRRAYYCSGQTKTQCGGHMNSTWGGNITGTLVDGADSCEFYLASDQNLVIIIDAVANFAGTCDTDYLEVRSGTGDGPLIDKYCATNPLPASLDTASNPVFLTWKTTTSTLTGTWRTIIPDCCNKLTLKTDNSTVKDQSSFLFRDWSIYPTTPKFNGRDVFVDSSGSFCTFWSVGNGFLISRCSDLEVTVGFAFGRSSSSCARFVKDWRIFLQTARVTVEDPTMRFECTEQGTTGVPPTTPALGGCCRRKSVGGETLLFKKTAASAVSEKGCMDECVYEKENQPGTTYCLKADGDLPAECLSG